MNRPKSRAAWLAFIVITIAILAGAAASSIAPRPVAQPPGEVGVAVPTSPPWLSINTSGIVVLPSPAFPTASALASRPTVLSTRSATWATTAAVPGYVAERLTLFLQGPPRATEFSVTVGVAGSPSLPSTIYFETNSTVASLTLSVVMPLGTAATAYSITAVTLFVNVCPSVGVCP